MYSCSICKSIIFSNDRTVISYDSFYPFIVCRGCGTENEVFDYPLSTNIVSKRIDIVMSYFCKTYNIQSIKQKPKQLFLELVLHIDLKMDYFTDTISPGVFRKKGNDSDDTLNKGCLNMYTLFDDVNW
jgi:hypothetical protein